MEYLMLVGHVLSRQNDWAAQVVCYSWQASTNATNA